MKFAVVAIAVFAALAVAQARPNLEASVSDRSLVSTLLQCFGTVVLRAPSSVTNLLAVINDSKTGVRDLYLTARQCSGRSDFVDCTTKIINDMVDGAKEKETSDFDKVVDALDGLEEIFNCLFPDKKKTA